MIRYLCCHYWAIHRQTCQLFNLNKSNHFKGVSTGGMVQASPGVGWSGAPVNYMYLCILSLTESIIWCSSKAGFHESRAGWHEYDKKAGKLAWLYTDETGLPHLLKVFSDDNLRQLQWVWTDTDKQMQYRCTRDVLSWFPMKLLVQTLRELRL